MNSWSSISSTAHWLQKTQTPHTQLQHECAQIEQKFEALNRVIDSITRDFSRPALNARLKPLVRKSPNAATTIVDHILAEQTERNIKSSTAESKIKGEELAGVWEGMLVSDSAITPRSQLFYFNYEDGELDMRYLFVNMLQGRSDVKTTDSLFRLDDQTPLYDELRIVTRNLAVGQWVTEWSDEE
jgi:hypothetical protein